MHAQSSLPFQRLALLKKAMRRASREIARTYTDSEAVCIEDRLSCTLAFIRAAENCSARVTPFVHRYPLLKKLVNLQAISQGNMASLQHARDHAVELAQND
eukprot:5328547-Karenia_brevis.AAC.1